MFLKVWQCTVRTCVSRNHIIQHSKASYSTKDPDDDKNRPKQMLPPIETDRDIVIRRLKNELTVMKNTWEVLRGRRKKVFDTPEIPGHCDVVVIGGGGIGSSIAYWLKRRIYKDFRVVVIERDPSYTKSSTALSVGGLRQQFSLPENIEMSLYGAEFLRNINEILGIEGDAPINVNFCPHGYLTLASEQGAQTLLENSRLQNSLGAKNKVLTSGELKNMFPWLNTDGIEVGCLGLEKEGWFDPWALLCAFKRKALTLGVEYLHAEAVGFILNEINEPEPLGIAKHSKRMRSVVIQTPDGEVKSIDCAVIVIAAGAHSAKVAELAHIGRGPGLLSVPLPVEPRKRYVYCFHCNNGPGLNAPLTIDNNGTYFRRDGLGGHYICGQSPSEDEEPSIENLDVDHEFFENKIWPTLAHRVKAFEDIKVQSSWAGYYEYNTLDQNGVLGFHPQYCNICIATGFSGHGIQHAPAVGRAMAEIIIEGKYMTIDLTRLGFERFLTASPLREANIV